MGSPPNPPQAVLMPTRAIAGSNPQQAPIPQASAQQPAHGHGHSTASSHPDPFENSGIVIAGRWRIGKKLGSGAFGSIYLGNRT
jgi:hypothetical protein